VLLDSDPQATERLLEIAERHRADSSANSVGSEQKWRSLDVQARLASALVKGITDYLEEDIGEAVKAGFTPLEIVEKALMDGMHQVGELFGSGRMFLPQVVKSARVMKKAVTLLEPYMVSSEGEERETILLATVKGDVHDIGKNIVGVVLGCNGYKVVDLGVMVPEEEIVAKAVESKAKIIGLSALITPSLAEIVNVVKALERKGLQIPVLVGGAATSATHTAVKVAPHYSSGTVVYVADASLVTEVVGSILDPLRSEEYLQRVRSEQVKLQESWSKEDKLLSWEEAKRRAPHFTWLSDELKEPAGVVEEPKVAEIPLKELLPYINWTQFLNSWKIKGSYPKIFDDPGLGAKAYKVYSDGRSILEYICKTEALQVKAVYGFWPAYSLNEDIYLYSGEKIIAKIPTLRQQREGLEVCLSLADFIAPEGLDNTDYLGMFALSSGFGLEKLQQLYKDQDDEYSSLMVGLLADRLCEAASEYLHKKVRALCGWPDREGLEIEDILKGHYKGIRPAPGYPACPDHYLKKIIWQFLHPEENIGLKLTESTALWPASSISGFYFVSPKARYFSLGKIDRQQLLDYHQRWGRSPEDLKETEKWLSLHLDY
ncbi:B12-binding domain-containing protein, partial [bacterium]|nr:B12-binding domain-containing protein [bacterium]